MAGEETPTSHPMPPWHGILRCMQRYDAKSQLKPAVCAAVTCRIVYGNGHGGHIRRPQLLAFVVSRESLILGLCNSRSPV